MGTSTHLHLSQYVEWLKANKVTAVTTADQILKDFEDGWHYQSDIPIGFGLGSSGAFVAAIYDRYIQDQEGQTEGLSFDTMSIMESYFHGSSSGMDPMVSWSGQAVYKDEKGLFQHISDPGWPEGFRAYLLNTGIGRTTAPLVQQYKVKLGQEGFKVKVERQLIPMVEHAIHYYLSGTGLMLEECLHVISTFQREHFAWLIPDKVKEQWDLLVAMPGVYVKFCGAGGGGYFLVISASERELPGANELIRVF
jgi:mevalonate kinase